MLAWPIQIFHSFFFFFFFTFANRIKKKKKKNRYLFLFKQNNALTLKNVSKFFGVHLGGFYIRILVDFPNLGENVTKKNKNTLTHPT